MGLLSSVADLLFPPKCPFCWKILDRADARCEKCADKLSYTTDGGRQSGESFAVCVSPFYFDGVIRDSIHRYKFGGAQLYAEVYGKVLADCIAKHVDVEYDIISWIPLSDRRLRERGYDQAFLLAQSTAKSLGVACVATLRKIKNVQAQSDITGKQARSINIAGAYEAVNPPQIAGKTILLIDDVITTGSTIDECANVLLSAGAKKIVCATLARTPHGMDMS